MGIFDRAKKLSSQIREHYSTAKALAIVINDKLPEDKQLSLPNLNESDSVKENTTKLVHFIHNLQEFVEDLDKCLEESLSPVQYAGISKTTTPVEDILPTVQTVIKGIVAIVGPYVTTIAKKVRNSQVLQILEKKLGNVRTSAVLEAIHDSVTTKGCLDEAHPGIKENQHQLDDHIKSLEPEVHNDQDFSSTVKSLVVWHRRASMK